MFKKLQYRLLLISLICLLFSCGGRNSSQVGSSDEYDITVEAGTMAVSQTDLMITVKDKSGNPINDATVSVKGDMSHAGMQPVLGESSSADNGVYMIPYEWTMAGDWFITIDVTFADGTIATERFDFNGIGGDAMDMDGEEMDHSEMDMDSDE